MGDCLLGLNSHSPAPASSSLKSSLKNLNQWMLDAIIAQFLLFPLNYFFMLLFVPINVETKVMRSKRPNDHQEIETDCFEWVFVFSKKYFHWKG